MDNLEESIMIIAKNKLDFVNDKFLEMFQSQIDQMVAMPQADSKVAER